MSLFDIFFNKFRDTVVIKDHSNLEVQLSEMRLIRDNLADKTKIDLDMKLVEFGIQGEKEILYELKNANLGLYVLRDITIEIDDMRAQIDFVIVSKGYVYLVECKNMIGNIYVDNQGQFQREYTINDKKIKEAIYSPYTQSCRHKDIITKKILANSNFLSSYFINKTNNSFYKPIVVLANSKSILNISNAPKEIKENVIRSDQLVNYIKKDLEKFNNTDLSSQKTMYEIANSFLKADTNYYQSIENKYKNNDLVINKISIDKEKLKEKLIEFRKERSKKLNMSAYYVFNNEEMDKIIDKLPQSIDDLKDILPLVKIKKHGKEIIEVINNFR